MTTVTDGGGARTRRRHPRARLWLLAAILVVVAVAALAAGRFAVPPVEILRMIAGQVFPVEKTWFDQEATVIFDVRLPRVILSILIGGALALGGAVLQALFRNPLVSPDIIGVSAGSSFGGVLALVFGLGGGFLVGGAFFFGLLALGLVLLLGRLGTGNRLLMIVLGGIVVGSLFNALVSLATYVADPYSTLPSIVFWLMGSLATATYAKIAIAGIPILLGGAVLLALRWRFNILSLGDEDARALGVNPGPTRAVAFVAVALMTAASVAVAGAVGWVGLVVPHLARMIVGDDNRLVLPASALLGAAYLTVIDTLSRSLIQAELPLGILTAIIGAPFFIVLLFRGWKAEASA